MGEVEAGGASGSGMSLQGQREAEAGTTSGGASSRRRRRREGKGKGKGNGKGDLPSGGRANGTGAGSSSSSSSARTTDLLIPHQVFQHVDSVAGQGDDSSGSSRPARNQKRDPRRKKKKSSEASGGADSSGGGQKGPERGVSTSEASDTNPNTVAAEVDGKKAKDKPQTSKRRGKKEKKKSPKWWKSLTETDPITLEPLSQLRCEPFGIDSSGLGVYNWFDGKILSTYLVSTCVFVNPMTNLPLTRDTCLALDLHLIKHRLGKPCVAKMFDYTEEKKKNAAQDPMPQSVRSLQEEANAIMNALFSGISVRGRQGDGGGGQRQRQPPPRGGRQRNNNRSSALRSEARPFNPNGGRGNDNVQGPFPSLAGFQRMEERGHSMIDDDIGLIPGNEGPLGFQHRVPQQPVSHFPPLSSNGQVPGEGSGPISNAGLNWLSRVQVESEVEGAAPSASSSSLGAVAGPSDVVSFPKRAGGENKDKGKEAISSYEAALIEKLESLVVEETGATEEKQKRKQQLADAFGVRDPDRPSQFALSSCSSADFPEDVVAYAAEHLSFVVKVERVVQYFSVQVTTKRLALPPMANMQRKVVHVVCNLFRVVSQAYGTEPSRWIDLMKSPSPSAAPVKSLSEIARARLAGKPLELDEVEKWEIKLADIDPDCDIWVLKEILLYQMHIECEKIEFVKDRTHAKNLKFALVSFSSRESWNQAKSLIGGGMRGIFVVSR